MGFGFWPSNFLRVVSDNLARFPGGSFFFFKFLKVKWQILKLHRFFSEKYILNLQFVLFSRITHFYNAWRKPWTNNYLQIASTLNYCISNINYKCISFFLYCILVSYIILSFILDWDIIYNPFVIQGFVKTFSTLLFIQFYSIKVYVFPTVY